VLERGQERLGEEVEREVGVAGAPGEEPQQLPGVAVIQRQNALLPNRVTTDMSLQMNNATVL
jgi:hypothetical protein